MNTLRTTVAPTRAYALARTFSRASAGLLIFSVLCVFLYCALLLLTVSHAAQRQKAQREIRELTANISSLESQYLAQTQDITARLGQELGMVEPAHTATVYTAARTLSMAQ